MIEEGSSDGLKVMAAETGSFWPRLCKNVFERDRYLKSD